MNRLTPVVKNLLILNGLMFLATMVLQGQGIDLNGMLGLYYPGSDAFKPVQLIAHMFLHGGFMHLFFNMFALWMFGGILEQRFGPQRFLTYYLVTGFGAAMLHLAVIHLQVMGLTADVDAETLRTIAAEGLGLLETGRNYSDAALGKLNILYNIPTVGASGAVFGLLLAFGMLFPDVPLMLIFFPVPIKAKYFVIGYAVIELVAGLGRIPGDNIAHFAHLGGMLFGYLLIRFWRRR
jgi:membrane associated rhomboid family serine protease